MFYRPNSQHLKDQLEERLRTALDFATLGAYELTGEAPSGGSSEPVHSPSPQAPQKRVFLFAKVSPPCPHSRAAADTCDAAGADAAEHHRASAFGGSVVGTQRRSRRSRRGGAVQLSPQPCTWAAERPQG
jgi:hypothetical protein